MGSWGVGMPATLRLEEFGAVLHYVFGDYVFLVGSVLRTTQWRDVDVRVILEDGVYEREFGDPRYAHSCGKWCAMVRAFSALGREMTGLPIDFQIQHMSYANAVEDGPRSSIGNVEYRFVEPPYCNVDGLRGLGEHIAGIIRERGSRVERRKGDGIEWEW